mgnify:CR=1 FL=1
MKIFISHSSKNDNYGNALVDLLTEVGISGEQIIFTSNDAYGIPIGQNIFNWLKNRINEKPYVIYLLSPEYYSSVACLNEMGAAWVVENEHTMIFTPNFNLSSCEFQNGVLDPREIGFFINNQDRLTAFIVSLKKSFSVSNNPVEINQKIRKFISRIESFQTNTQKSSEKSLLTIEKEAVNESNPSDKKNDRNSKNRPETTERFFLDLLNDKLKDEEVLLLHYIIDNAKFKLGTGWQESNEVENIKAWEDIVEINNTLSRNYSAALRRLEMRKLTEVSELTSHGNPKEVRIIDRIQEILLDLPESVINKIDEIISKNKNEELPF